MYLETIYILSQKNGAVRSVDVGETMHVSKPSVSRAVGILKKEGYLRSDADGHLLLSESGHAIAKKVYDRHITLSAFLTRLGVPPEIAVRDACKIEHVISDETFAALKQHVQKYNSQA